MKGILIQAVVILFTVGATVLSTILIANAIEKEVVYVSTLKMGAFSDIHANPFYDPNITNEWYCIDKVPNQI